MIDFTSNELAALEDSSVETAWLVKIKDNINTALLTTWNDNIIFGSETYMGNGALLSVTPPTNCVINTGSASEAQTIIFDPQMIMFNCFMGFADRNLNCIAKFMLFHTNTITIDIFSGKVNSVDHESSNTIISVGSKINLLSQKAVYLTNEAQKKRKAGDNTLSQLARDIFLDWR